MTTPWSHLPNAAYIDDLLVKMSTSGHQWLNTVWFSTNVKWQEHASWRIAHDTITKNGLNDIYNSICLEIYSITSQNWGSEFLAVAALVAYDDCGYMLDSDPGELAILAKFGDERAILLLTACTIFAKEKQK